MVGKSRAAKSDKKVICNSVSKHIKQIERTMTGQRRHKFSQEIKDQVAPLMIQDNYHGVLAVLSDWMWIFGMIHLSELVHLHLAGTGLNLLVYLLAVVKIGCQMRSLACLLHSSTHRTLAENKWLNLALGSVFSGWSVMISWTGYHRSHIHIHHHHLGDKDRDPDYQQMIKIGLYDQGVTKEDIRNYLKGIVSLRSTLEYMRYIVQDRLLPSSEHPVERILRLVYYLLILITLYYTNCLKYFLFYWLLPTLTTANWMGTLCEFLEHYPLLGRGQTDEMYLSRNRIHTILESFFFYCHNEGYHLVHHLFPRVPDWNLPNVHAILMQDPEYRVLQKGIGLKCALDDVFSYFEK